VVYVKEGGGVVESFSGQALTLSLDTYTGVFLGGLTERAMAGSERTYRFTGNVISRAEEDVTVMEDAVITNPKTEQAYWSISASKLWLLPGSEWAILNAVLRVGEIPMLYIPFFFIPGDQLVFHPVLGYRSREGSFLQTTTYILGRPKVSASSENSIVRILGTGDDSERRREGMFLRSLGKRQKPMEEPRLSLLFDAYTNLGAYLGTEASLPKLGVLSSSTLSAGIGLTRNVFKVSNEYYTPFAQFDGSSDWNTSRFLFWPLPVRYRFKSEGSLRGSAGSLTWSLPFYSDPFIDQDFLNRSEQMDWVTLLKQGAAVEDPAAKIGVLTGYELRLGASPVLSFPSLSPYLASLSVSNASSALIFRTRTSAGSAATPDPKRSFFYPDRLTIISLSAAAAGTPFTFSGGTGAGSTDSAAGAAADDRDTIPELVQAARPPWEAPERPLPKTESVPLSPPVLSQRFEPAVQPDSTKLSLNYRISPSGSSEVLFHSQPWKEREDVRWDDLSSLSSTVRTDGEVSVQATGPGEHISGTWKLASGLGWQGYAYMNEKAGDYDTQAKRDSALLRAYRSTFFTTTSEAALIAKPFKGDPVWGASSFQYTLKNLLAKSAFEGTPGDPRWNILYGAWTKEDLEFHRLAAQVGALIRNYPQNLTLSLDLPPEDSLLSAKADLRAYGSLTAISASVVDPFETPLFEPISFSETLDFGGKRLFRQSFVYDTKLEAFTSFNTVLTLGAFSTAYSAAYSMAYQIEEGFGWKYAPGAERLLPKAFSMDYLFSRKLDWAFPSKMSAGVDVDTRLHLDLQRYTYSTFNFSLACTLKIADFLDLTISAKSSNAVFFRYLQDLPWWDTPVDLPGEKNLLVDLVDSFRFDDENLRKKSGFKLKSFGLAAVHYMGDWNAKLGIDLSPYLDRTSLPFRYNYNTQVSFLVQWIPISEIKTEIKSDKDGFLFK
jgi:hypothetical protein